MIQELEHISYKDRAQPREKKAQGETTALNYLSINTANKMVFFQINIPLYLDEL